jgi:hypothetical protein
MPPQQSSPICLMREGVCGVPTKLFGQVNARLLEQPRHKWTNVFGISARGPVTHGVTRHGLAAQFSKFGGNFFGVAKFF